MVEKHLEEIKEWNNTIEWFEKIMDNFAWTGHGKNDPRYENLEVIRDFIINKRNESIKKLNKFVEE